MNPWRKHRRQKLRRQCGGEYPSSHLVNLPITITVSWARSEDYATRPMPWMDFEGIEARMLAFHQAHPDIVRLWQVHDETVFVRKENDDGTFESDADFIARVYGLNRLVPVTATGYALDAHMALSTLRLAPSRLLELYDPNADYTIDERRERELRALDPSKNT